MKLLANEGIALLHAHIHASASKTTHFEDGKETTCLFFYFTISVQFYLLLHIILIFIIIFEHTGLKTKTKISLQFNSIIETRNSFPVLIYYHLL